MTVRKIIDVLLVETDHGDHKKERDALKVTIEALTAKPKEAEVKPSGASKPHRTCEVIQIIQIVL